MSRLREIEAFTQIARAGSISRAAARLSVAKSAVSKRLADLEARLGVQLVNRTTRAVSLTDAGANFLARASVILDDLNEAEAAASAGQSELAGKLKIAAPVSFGLNYLTDLISSFACSHPHVSVEADFSDRWVDLLAEGFDLAIRIGVLPDSSLIARKLCPVRLAVAAAPKFWDAHGRPKTPQDLAGLDCLRYSNLARPGAIPYWGPKGARGAIEPPIRLLASNGEFITRMAVDGCGFVVEPTFIMADRIRDGSLELALTDYAWSNFHLYAVYPPTRQLSARVRAFVDVVIAKFGSNPYWDDGLGLN